MAISEQRTKVTVYTDDITEHTQLHIEMTCEDVDPNTDARSVHRALVSALDKELSDQLYGAKETDGVG